MADQEDVRRIALALPDTSEAPDHFAFSVRNGAKEKGFAWVWLERVDPKKARVPQPEVLAIRVANAEEKESLLASDTEKFFTEPHYNGYPAVLVRLAAVEGDELRELLTDAWRCQAPKKLVAAYDAG
ncbi:MAG TPA: MmcQ/YjbR family DNA-binding protein [Kribbellaceae bacterium]|nr:MmcQ/YjbR family DNA-binding protein [Kribbellaceae bacterium]